jgi:photosystem II stability/assembly factor-like uncharacterized protein
MQARKVLEILLMGFVVIVLVKAGLVREEPSTTRSSKYYGYDQDYEKLMLLQKHVMPNTPEALKIEEKIKKIERRRSGYAKPEHPDEFVRILHDMKIPYGAKEPAYSLNYRAKELRRAKLLSLTPAETLPWIERGPGNVSGRARGLIVDPTDPTGNTWFVGSVGGGIWKSTNAGQTWIDLTPDFASLAVSTLAMSASNPDIMYAGTGESMYSVDVINGDGIYKSEDHGDTWFQLSSTINNPNFNNISRILVDPQNPDAVIASASTGRYKINVKNESGIYKSTDGGVTWTEVYRETDIGVFGRAKKVLQIIDTPGNFDILYGAIDEKGIIKSTDAGDNWVPSSNGITDFSGRFEIAISPSNPDKIYAAAEGSPNSILWVSNDAGNSWVRTTENGQEPNWLASQGWYDNTIVVHPANENTVYVGGVRLFQIDVLPNNTRNTNQLSTGPVHVDHHNLVIIPKVNDSFRILNANDGGIGVSTDSVDNWSKPTLGMNTSQFYGVDKKPGASAYIGGMQDNGTWRSPENSDAASLWTFQIGGDGYETSWHFNDPSKIIGGSQYNGLRRSLDGGLSWASATNGLGNTGSGSAPFITKIAKSNMEPDLLFAVGSSGVWRSTNFGASWALSPITGSNWGGVSTFLDVKISRANPNVVWAGSRMDPSGKINVSTDQGLTFNPTPVYSLQGMGGISGLATHPQQDSTAYVLFSFAHKPKILRTKDLGQNWEDISGFGTDTVSSNGFPDVAVYDLIVLPHTPDTIWVGTEIGLFESTDNGATWNMANNGLPALPIWAMTHVEGEVVLATHGRGIWSVSIPGLSKGQTFSPLIKELFQGPSGLLSIGIGLRSIYDSTSVLINGNLFVQLGPNPTPADTLLDYMVTQSGLLTLSIKSYKNGVSYESVSRNINVIVYSQPQVTYINDFNAPSNDFIGSGFQIKSEIGFNDDAIHSSHPYSDNQNITYALTVPIVVANSNANFVYDDVAIIEPGEPGTVFGDTEFWDYVVVEGSNDGINWVPIADGYDSRYDAAWLNAYNIGSAGNVFMYRTHQVDMSSTFAPGVTILLRFRLFADAFVNGWGWAIDNVRIQESATGISENNQLPFTFALSQNYPNPFNPATVIHYQLPEVSLVNLSVYNMLGQKVKTVLSENQIAGNHTAKWDGTNDRGEPVASGIYIYQLQAGKYVQSKKMMLLK